MRDKLAKMCSGRIPIAFHLTGTKDWLRFYGNFIQRLIESAKMLLRLARAKNKLIHCSKKRQYEERVIAEAHESVDRNDMRSFYATANDAQFKNASVIAWLCNERATQLKLAAFRRFVDHNAGESRNRINIG